MKRDVRFIIGLTFLGALSGLMAALILMAIAAPANFDSVLTLTEKADFDRLSQLGAAVSAWLSSSAVRILSLALGFAAFGIFLAIINPRLAGAFRSKTGMMKAAVITVLCMLLSAAAEFASGSRFLIPVFTALIWLIAGERGWAGDFTSWRMVNARPTATLLLGGAFGLAVWAVVAFFSWTGGKYFLLVSEALDGSGEVSLRGFELLTWGMTAAFAVGMAIAAGSASALAPTDRTARERLRLAIVPVALFLGTVVITGFGYRSYSEKYDLDKPSLAAAAGIPSSEHDNRTVVLLKTADDQPKNWPLQTTVSVGISPAESIAVSSGNLRKIEDYLAKHEEGTVFRYAARQALISGYNQLWDTARALDIQYASAGDMLLPRFLLIAKLSALQNTEKHLRYLKHFSDETKWHIGPKYALKIADACEHFGLEGEAAKWRDNARAGGADLSNSHPPVGTALPDGIIEGRIRINGKPASGIRVGLLQDDQYLKELESFSVQRRLISAQDSDATGTFRFDRLGKGAYVLGIMAKDELLPATSRIRIEKAPGSMQLSVGHSRVRLADINMIIEGPGK